MEVDRPLMSGGQGVLSARGTSSNLYTGSNEIAALIRHGPKSARRTRDMTIEEMESSLAKKPQRMPNNVSTAAPGQAEKAVLHQNKLMIDEKRGRKGLERKGSRDFIETILAKDRLNNESDKARARSRRTAQQELATYYKSRIADNHFTKVDAYRSKVDNGAETQYFPFVEGETISKSRDAQNSKMRDEMRDHMRQQREANPPRADALLADTDKDHGSRYPPMPVHSHAAMDGMSQRVADATPHLLPMEPSESFRNTAAATLLMAGDDVAPHLGRYPRFLSRAREHMSRRLHDDHVRKALEDKVQRTKAELEELAKQRKADVESWRDGTLVNDALRYDASQNIADGRKANQEFLRKQMDERKGKLKGEVCDRRAEACGYFGPEEKCSGDFEQVLDHGEDLLQQMKVNDDRKINDKERKLRLERRLVDNSLAEMAKERKADVAKAAVQRKVLTTTWNSQKQIRKALNDIEAM